jgi:hypothetical protein
MHRSSHSFLVCFLGKVLRLEEVEPQLLVGSTPKYPSQTAAKMATYEIEWGEMMEFHPVIMWDGPHKTARRYPEPPLVESNKADHVSLRWRRLPVAGRWHHPLR